MVAPFVNCSASSESCGCVITKSASPHAFTHCEKEFATHCGKGFTCGAHVNTIFGLRCSVKFSLIVITSVKLCNGCSVALSKLITGTLQYLMNCEINNSL